MHQKSPAKWFYGVDSIRFVLALLVMLSHFDNVYADSLKHSAYLPVKLFGIFLANAFDGTSAVIAFFIISGFVIHYPCKEGIDNLLRFWIRRFLRILIPLAVVISVGTAFNHPEKTVTWSLFCEMIYYALYPLLFKINLSWKTKLIITWLIALLVIVIGSYHDIVSLFKQTNDNYHGYYWQFGNYITWIIGLPCWLLGVLIAENIDHLKNISFSKVFMYRLLVYGISCFCCFGKFHLYMSYLLSMSIFALLLYKWIQAEIVYYKNRRPNLVLEKMGKFSYSLYLSHPLAFLLLNRFITLNNFTYLLFVILTIIAAYIFYLLVERPSHTLARRINKKYFSPA